MVLDTAHNNKKRIVRSHSETTRIVQFGDISSISETKILNPLESLSEKKIASITELLEVILNWSQSSFGIDEFVDAKKEFFESFGRIFPDDDFYNQRITYFLDYFTFERPTKHIQESGRKSAIINTPFNQFLKSAIFKNLKSTLLTDQFYELEDFRHSLFYVAKVNKYRMVVKDLITKDKIEFGKNHHFLFQGFSSGSIIQGFIFNLKNEPHISQGIITHPPSVSRIIRKNLTKLKKNQPFDEFHFLTKLAKQNLNTYRHRTQDIKKVYLQDPR